MNDDLNGIFDDLDPMDFSGVTSWTQGCGSFEEFVDNEIMSTRKAWLASDGQINPVAVMANEDRVWLYAPDDDETNAQYLDRLHVEAERIGAQWLYIAKQTMVGVRSDGQPIETLVTEADAEESLSEGVLYYAADRGKEERHGIMAAHGNRLGEVVKGNPDQPIAMFSAILD